jgi:CubicO group peptidase (beta-lactamase class C family)
MHLATRRIRSLCLAVALVPGASVLPLPAQESAGAFADADRAARDLPRLYSLLVSRDGKPLFEAYYNGAGPSRATNIKSASKSVISALVGIALDQGLIPDVRYPVGGYFSDLLPAPEDPEGAARRSITIEDLLTMRSGLETTSNQNYGAWVSSRNWVRYALGQPLEAVPGTRMIYSTGSTHLLSAILTEVSGSDTRRFAQEYLTGPMGFPLSPWTRDPQGIYFGGNEMAMTPRQLLAFGDLYLNEGQTRDGTRILSPEWVRETFVARVASPRERGRFYGYGWWIRDMAGYATHYAWGYGGQFVFVVPGLDLVVVTTSDPNPGDDRRGHLQRIYDLVEEHVVRLLGGNGAP